MIAEAKKMMEEGKTMMEEGHVEEGKQMIQEGISIYQQIRNIFGIQSIPASESQQLMPEANASNGIKGQQMMEEGKKLMEEGYPQEACSIY